MPEFSQLHIAYFSLSIFAFAYCKAVAEMLKSSPLFANFHTKGEAGS
jgi:hypothetical protein